MRMRLMGFSFISPIRVRCERCPPVPILDGSHLPWVMQMADRRGTVIQLDGNGSVGDSRYWRFLRTLLDASRCR
ncbi:hypothetical protein F5Y15DRAFT_118834 [Xylariaceae sp. FL0016]|nr:hypothetical protein F5Y15DRAFT_118834 [Xylariaceae sp. FL0016]